MRLSLLGQVIFAVWIAALFAVLGLAVVDFAGLFQGFGGADHEGLGRARAVAFIIALTVTGVGAYEDSFRGEVLAPIMATVFRLLSGEWRR